jgi:hypothetical protein
VPFFTGLSPADYDLYVQRILGIALGIEVDSGDFAVAS